MKLELPEALVILKDLLSKGELILFAGSGMSIDSDLPNWDDLIISFMEMAQKLPLLDDIHRSQIDEIINDANQSISENRFDPIKVASVLKKKIKESDLAGYPLALSEYSGWIQRVFLNHEPNDYHNLIVKINFPYILTSNYDLLFEKAAVKNGFKELGKNTLTFKDELKAMSTIKYKLPGVIHVHGSAHELSIDEIIFTKEDYNKLILNKYSGFSFSLRMNFTMYSTLFVGYGASDPHLEEIMEEIADYFPQGIDASIQDPIPNSFLVTLRSKADSVLERWKDRVRTSLIVIDKYDDYLRLFKELKNTCPRS